MARALLPQNVCHTLWCSVGTTCHSKLDAAVDGTTCGESKVGLRPGSLLRLCEASAWLGGGACPQGPPVPSGPRPRRRAQMRGRAGGCSRRPLGDQHVGSLSSSAAPPGPSRAPRPPCALRGGHSSALFAVVSGRGVCGRGPPARGGGRGLVGLERLVRLLAELRRGRAERRAAVHAAHVSLGPRDPGRVASTVPSSQPIARAWLSPSLPLSEGSPSGPSPECPEAPGVTCRRVPEADGVPTADPIAERGTQRPRDGRDSAEATRGWREAGAGSGQVPRAWALGGSGSTSPLPS